MDLNTVSDIVAAKSCEDVRRAQAGWQRGDVWLGGGTLLFSEPQPRASRLVDLTTSDWPALTVTDDGLEIAATCTIAEISKAGGRMPDDWLARPLFHECCTAFLASFKVWNLATLGGNLCASYPAGPMISLTAALDGECEIWTTDGGTRRQPVRDFVTGSSTNTLRPGELLRAVRLPISGLRARTAFRKIALSPVGRSGVVIIGRLDPTDPDVVHVTVTSATVRPVVVDIRVGSSSRAITKLIDAAIPRDLYTEDAHGAPDWRRQVTLVLADEIVDELSVPEESYPEAELDGSHEPRQTGEWGYGESGGDAA